MNKGKPSGFKADTKKDAGAKSSSRPRAGQAGAGPALMEANPQTREVDTSILRSVSERNGAEEAVNPFPEIRNGASTNGDSRKQVMRFEFTSPTAARVCIAGTFNDWHPNATEMIALGDGQWRKELLLPPGEYEYRLVVDGAWIADPACADGKPNGLGETNSILRVREV
jgi:hypothetical protein